MPDEAAQEKLMQLIFRIKANDRDLAIALEMEHLAQTMINQGAEIILAACTEVPLVLDQSFITAPLISSTDALVDAVILYATFQHNSYQHHDSREAINHIFESSPSISA